MAKPRRGSAGKPKPKPLEQAEEITILEEIARTGSAIARIQALKMLRSVRGKDEASGDEDTGPDEFSELDELEPRRRKRSQ